MAEEKVGEERGWEARDLTVKGWMVMGEIRVCTITKDGSITKKVSKKSQNKKDMSKDRGLILTLSKYESASSANFSWSVISCFCLFRWMTLTPTTKTEDRNGF